MTEAKKSPRSRWTFWLIVIVCVAPVLIAVILYANRSWVAGGRHFGTLIDPVIPVGRGEFVGFDQFSSENIKEIRGHWVLLHFITPHGCGLACREALEKTRRVRLMLGKDLMRIRRLAVVVAETSEAQAEGWWSGHPYLLRTFSNRTLEKFAKSVMGSPIPDGAVIIMDPIGNWMMWYPAGFNPYELKKDLQRLLLVSRIG
jgi:hypothetical protein